MKNFIYNQYAERLAILNTESIKICGQINLKAIKMQFVCIFFHFAEYRQNINIWIFIFPR